MRSCFSTFSQATPLCRSEPTRRRSPGASSPPYSMRGRRSWFRSKSTRPARTDHQRCHPEACVFFRNGEILVEISTETLSGCGELNGEERHMKTAKDAKSKGTILIADYDFGDVNIERAIIEGAGFKIVAAQCKSEDEVIEHGRDADGVLAQYAPIGARAISAFTRCRVIARYGTGVDIVDVDAATRRGIQVTNVPNDWCQNEVADHAMALLLAAARKICAYDRATRAGVWRWQSAEPIHRMQGRTLGLLSFGAIAQAIAARAHAFGMHVIA